MTEILAWHWTADTLRDGRPIPPVGETLRHDGPLVLCKSGLHASERLIDSLDFAPGNRLHRVRCGGEVQHENDKLVCRERTILWSHAVSDGLLRGFARSQARSVIHLWEPPQVVRDYLETGDEALREAASAAAWAARAGAARAAAAWAARAGAARAGAAWAGAAWAARAGAARAGAAWAAAWAAAEAAAEAAWAAAWVAEANKELTDLILAEAGRSEP